MTPLSDEKEWVDKFREIWKRDFITETGIDPDTPLSEDYVKEYMGLVREEYGDDKDYEPNPPAKPEVIEYYIGFDGEAELSPMTRMRLRAKEKVDREHKGLCLEVPVHVFHQSPEMDSWSDFDVKDFYEACGVIRPTEKRNNSSISRRRVYDLPYTPFINKYYGRMFPTKRVVEIAGIPTVIVIERLGPKPKVR